MVGDQVRRICTFLSGRQSKKCISAKNGNMRISAFPFIALQQPVGAVRQRRGEGLDREKGG